MLLRSILISMFIDFHATLTLNVHFLEETRGFIVNSYKMSKDFFQPKIHHLFLAFLQPKIP